MTKRWWLAVLAAVMVACALVPTTALAGTTKVGTGIRGLSTGYVIHGTSGDVTLSGRLVYRKQVRRHGKKVTIDAPLAGGIYLLRSDEPYGPGQVVGWKWSASSAFSFSVTSGGWYRVRYAGNKKYKAADHWSEVAEDVISIKNLRAVSASHEMSGGLFVTISADFDAPDGIVTTATSAASIFVVVNGSDDRIGSLLGSGGSGLVATALPTHTPSDPFAGINNGFLQLLRRTGTYRYGFDVPDDQADQVFSVLALFESEHPFVVGAASVATFTPSALAP